MCSALLKDLTVSKQIEGRATLHIDPHKSIEWHKVPLLPILFKRPVIQLHGVLVPVRNDERYLLNLTCCISETEMIQEDCHRD